MRLILYSYEYPPLGGGVGNAIKNILFEFSKYPDLHIDFITSSINGKSSTERVYPNVIFHRLRMRRRCKEEYHKQTIKDMFLFSLKAYLYTWKLIQKNKYNFNHFFGFPGGLVSLLFRWKMKYIVSLRGVDVPGYNEKFKRWYVFYKPLSKLIWLFAERVVVNSQSLANLARLTFPSLPMKVIPNGVSVNEIKPISESKKYKHFTITAGGTILNEIKGLDYLIRGFAKLNREFSGTRLKLIGNGNFRNELRSLVTKLGIGDVVDFLGYRSHGWIEKNLARFHVFCLLSLSEGMSNAVLEGMAAGLPIIITKTGGAEKLIDGNGFIIEKRNSGQVYKKLRKLCVDREMRINMGRRSREIAKKMSWEKAACRYYRLYRELV